ncbi:MAG: 50S ribosomal protein L30 [Oscillospiraceae bacterium]|nr:50S ribosomal protein L30 [Oscillospiraceae bacterium]
MKQEESVVCGSLQIKLVKSLIGRKKSHVTTVHSLGLHKIGDKVIHVENNALNGKIAKILHLVKVSCSQGGL